MIERNVVLAYGRLVLLAGALGVSKHSVDRTASRCLVNAATHLISPLEPSGGSVPALLYMLDTEMETV